MTRGGKPRGAHHESSSTYCFIIDDRIRLVPGIVGWHGNLSLAAWNMHLQLRASRYARDYILSSHTCSSIIYDERKVFPLRRAFSALSFLFLYKVWTWKSLKVFCHNVPFLYIGNIFNTNFNFASWRDYSSSFVKIYCTSYHDFNDPIWQNQGLNIQNNYQSFNLSVIIY